MKLKKAILFTLAAVLIVLLCGCGSDEAVDAASVGKKGVQAGQTILFGRFSQTESGIDETPIEWTVLDYNAENNTALLLSKYALDMRRYSNGGFNNWESCELRKWLNGSFVNYAFNEEEQAALLFIRCG